MNVDLITSLLRTFLQIGGTYVATHGLVSADNWTLVSGAAITLVSTAWSVVAHWKPKAP